MQEVSDWIDPGGVEHLPRMILKIDGATWPPAEADLPVGSADVGHWSVDRDLTGGGLPGNARGASGFSVASGQVSFAQPSTAPSTPWAAGGSRVVTGAACSLVADQSPEGGELLLGRFVVDEAAGSNSSIPVILTLTDTSRRLNRPFTYRRDYDASDSTFDASEVIKEAARQSGFAEEQIDVEDTGSLLSGLVDLTDMTAWGVVQDVARATMGAAWISETGTLVYRNRNSLRTGAPVETVVADERLESLDWTVSIDDAADRVEVTYTPTQVTRDTAHRITLWEATSPILVDAGKSYSLTVPFESGTDRISPFYPLWTEEGPGSDPTQFSRWAASSSPIGTGTRPSDDAISVQVISLASSKARLRITNHTNGKLWLVDGSGNPALTVRTSLSVEPGEPETIASGVGSSDSVNMMTFDAGTWVQDAATAQDFLTWLTSQTTAPTAVIGSVRVKPDLRRQLGDVVIVTDEHTELQAKALISGIRLSGDSSGYTQHLTLALLDLTFLDLDAWANRQSITTFAELDRALSLAGVVTFDDFTAWADLNLIEP